MFKAGEKAFIVELNRFIREVTVKSCAGWIYLIKLEDGGGIKVKEHRLLKTKEDAEASIPKEKSKKTRSPYDFM